MGNKIFEKVIYVNEWCKSNGIGYFCICLCFTF